MIIFYISIYARYLNFGTKELSKENYLMEEVLKLTGNYFFPLILSVFLIFRIDKFLTVMGKEMKEIKETQTKMLFYLQTGCKSEK